VAIPETVEVMDGAFEGCASLTRAVHLGDTFNVYTNDTLFNGVHPGFRHFTKGLSINDGHPEFYYDIYANGLVIAGGDVLTYVGADRNVTVPPEVGGNQIQLIEENAFRGCQRLEHAVLPGSISFIGDAAFHGCSSLSEATFLGDAPGYFGSHVFDDTGSSFGIYYWGGAAGFTSPFWNGYPAYMMHNPPNTVASWLVYSGFDLHADLSRDPNGDGVSLLTAYALNLDPHKDLSGDLPKPVVNTNEMLLELAFYAGAEHVLYYVETSTNLVAWTTGGVAVSPPDPEQISTAMMDIDSPAGFMRLRFELLD
jgi:hypothetical protein